MSFAPHTQVEDNLTGLASSPLVIVPVLGFSNGIDGMYVAPEKDPA